MPEKQTKQYDAIIIGTGQGGIPLAKELAQAGWQVAIIEEKHVGGSCVNYGCTPTKALLASAHAAHSARKAGEYGISVQDVQVNMQEVKQRRDKLVDQSRKNNEDSLEESDAELIRGRAVFTGTRQLQIKSEDGQAQTLTAKHIIINTGAIPVLPDIEGLDEINYLDHKTIQDLTEVPEHLLVLGGGYIGLEFGQMFSRFGSKVTIIQHGEQLLDREDEDVAEEIKKILEDEGIEILLNAKTQKVVKQNGSIQLSIQLGKDKLKELQGSHLLVAIGVKANTEGLGLEEGGIETDKQGNIKTDEHLLTNTEEVYAIGDVKGGPQFTHISYDDFRILRDKFLHNKTRSIEDRPIPYCVFTDPQLGRIGLAEKQAKEKGINYKVAKLEMSKVARGIETGHTKGFMKVLVNDKDGQILGASILAAEGGEIMAALQIAMMGKVHYKQLQEGVFAHPTYTEAFNNLFKNLDQE